jgi:hypothetical protein
VLGFVVFVGAIIAAVFYGYAVDLTLGLVGGLVVFTFLGQIAVGPWRTPRRERAVRGGRDYVVRASMPARIIAAVIGLGLGLAAGQWLGWGDGWVWILGWGFMLVPPLNGYPRSFRRLSHLRRLLPVLERRALLRGRQPAQQAAYRRHPRHALA